MHCTYCGKQIPDNANFCAHCGGALKPDLQPESEGSWEYCQISWSGKWHSVRQWWTDVLFWADAIGKNRRYNAGQSATFDLGHNFTRQADPPLGGTGSDREKSANAYNDLVAKLISDGWEPLPERGASAWELRFRRRLKS